MAIAIRPAAIGMLPIGYRCRSASIAMQMVLSVTQFFLKKNTPDASKYEY